VHHAGKLMYFGFYIFCQLRLNFKAYCLRDAPAGLTFNNCTHCPNCIYVFCINLRTNSNLCLLEQKLVFITEMESVYRAVRPGFLNKAVCALSLKVYCIISSYVIYFSQFLGLDYLSNSLLFTIAKE